jgi:hypothetical protein
VRRTAWLFASLLALGAPKTAWTQSTNLSDLERVAPAATGDAVATGAASAWRSLWTVPAAAPALHGVMIGFEQNAFGSVTTVLGAARFRLGVLWQLQYAQAQVSGVIDPELLAQYPELATLRVMARFVSLDGVHTLGRTTVSAGLREESDELLGVSASGVTARSSVRLRLGYRTAIAGVFDRALSSGLGTPADGRVQIAVSQDVVTGAGRLQLDAGARMGRLRQSEISETEYALGATLSIQDIMSINATAGSDRLSQGPWTWRAALGVSIALGSVGAHFRYGFKPDGRGASRAMAFTYTRRDPATGLPR